MRIRGIMFLGDFKIFPYLARHPGWRRRILRIFLILVYGERFVVTTSSGSIVGPADRALALSTEALSNAKIALRNLNLEFVRNLNLKRVGNEFDGGYSLPDMEIAWAISGGTSGNDSFDLELAECGAKVLQIDDAQDSAPSKHQNLAFRRRRIGKGKGELGCADLLSLHSSIFGKSSIEGNSLLKLDIEGSEWEFFDEMTETHIWTNIVVEFHDLERLGEEVFSSVAARVWSKIASTHALVAVNGNSYCGFAVVGGIPIPKNIECTYVLRTKIGVPRVPSASAAFTGNDSAAFSGQAPLWLWGLSHNAPLNHPTN